MGWNKLKKARFTLLFEALNIFYVGRPRLNTLSELIIAHLQQFGGERYQVLIIREFYCCTIANP